MEKSTLLNVIAVFIFFGLLSSCVESKEKPVEAAPKNDITQFLGQWTFDFGDNHVGWLKVKQEDGYLDADLMWGGGGVFYGLPYVYIANDILYLGRSPRKMVLKKDEDGNEVLARNYPTWIELKRNGENISGYYLSPNTSGLGIDSTFINGTKLPDVPPAPDLSKVEYGKPINLIKNGNDLTGWSLIRENTKTNGWSMKNGVLTNNPVQTEGEEHISYGNLRTEQEFEDFNLKLEVNPPPHTNSGVYLRGMYEVQIADSYGQPLSWGGSMGAIFTRILPTENAEKPSGEWQTLDITFLDRHVTVVLNGTTIIDNQPIEGATGGAIQSDVFAPGPIYLQGDHQEMSYRNIVLTPIIN